MQSDFELARSFVGRRIGTRLVTGYLVTRIYGRRHVCLTMLCDCGRRSVIRLSQIKRQQGLKGCAACSSIPSVGTNNHGRGITELEAKKLLVEMEANQSCR